MEVSIGTIIGGVIVALLTALIGGYIGALVGVKTLDRDVAWLKKGQDRLESAISTMRGYIEHRLARLHDRINEHVDHMHRRDRD